MNIRQAKETIRKTVQVYLEKNEDGEYRLPAVSQRPVLLMGPPGVGKTAIMEQLAAECGIGFVSYNMTHHTRQSAVGLPHLAEREYEGRSVTVTEYTLSEIVASLYDCMKDTGCREGILFIDEINCVSETLAPTMLQFLQKKAFGSFRIPAGWIITAAGNSREYNRTAREYDIAVLDRLRRIDVYPDLEAWMSYASSEGVHGAILTYLASRPDHFFILKPERENPRYVTARGWQDLSELLYGYERQGLEADADDIRQYLTVPAVTEGFSVFYRLWRKYADLYGFSSLPEDADGLLADAEVYRRLALLTEQADRKERRMVIGLLAAHLTQRAAVWAYGREALLLTESRITLLEKQLSSCGEQTTAADRIEEAVREWEHALRVREEHGLTGERDAAKERRNCREMRNLLYSIREERQYTAEAAATRLRNYLLTAQKEQAERSEHLRQTLEAAFRCASECFDREEKKALVLGLAANADIVRFMSVSSGTVLTDIFSAVYER